MVRLFLWYVQMLTDWSNLSPQTYAELMGVNPLHFMGAYAPGLVVGQYDQGMFWTYHAWQSPNNISRSEVANELRNTENTIRDFLGYSIAPEWRTVEVEYPQDATNPYMWHVGQGPLKQDRLHGHYVRVNLPFNYLIQEGRRKATYVDTVAVSYVDLDGDGFAETGRVPVSWDVDESPHLLQAFYPATAGYSTRSRGDARRAIRQGMLIPDPDSPEPDYDTGGPHPHVYQFKAWHLITPEAQTAFPTNLEYYPGINLADSGNLLQEVELYRVENDPLATSCQLIWNPLAGQAEVVTVDATIRVLDKGAGIVEVLPYTWDSVEAAWVPSSLAACPTRRPDKIRIWIYAGFTNDELNYIHPPLLDDKWRASIRFLTTARLSRDLCGTNNVIALGRELREDMALVSPQGNFLAVADVIQECPFGTKRGEWLAWNALRHEEKFYPPVLIR